jgi:hypothetical protein
MIAINSGLPSATAQQNCALTVTPHRATVLLRADADCMAGEPNGDNSKAGAARTTLLNVDYKATFRHALPGGEHTSKTTLRDRYASRALTG